MKTPRINDFDPDAKAPSLKSSLDKMPSIEKPNSLPHTMASAPPPKKAATKHIDKLTRKFIKRTFDIYTDQLDFLRNLAFKGRLDGGDDSVNSMVREALDEWISKRKASEN